MTSKPPEHERSLAEPAFPGDDEQVSEDDEHVVDPWEAEDPTP